MSGPTENPIHRLIMAVGGALLLLSGICSLAFVWRDIALHREVVSAQAHVQQLNQTQQLIPAIAQDLAGLSQQHPWLTPILKKYGLAGAPQTAQAAPKKSE